MRCAPSASRWSDNVPALEDEGGGEHAEAADRLAGAEECRQTAFEKMSRGNMAMQTAKQPDKKSLIAANREDFMKRWFAIALSVGFATALSNMP